MAKIAKGLNDRQRLFALGLAEGKSATQAYVDAGFSENGAAQGAERLLRNVEVRRLRDEARAPALVASQCTLEEHITELAMLRDEARAAKQYAAAITAETNRGKVAGHYIDRVEDVTKIPREQRRERLLKLLS